MHRYAISDQDFERIAREGPEAIRVALKEHIIRLRGRAAMNLREALKLEQVSDAAFEVAWPGYWEEGKPSKLYYVKYRSRVKGPPHRFGAALTGVCHRMMIACSR